MVPSLQPGRRKGFTLIELLVVIAIIAILIALLVPAVQKVRAAAARTQCQNNMKQLGLACHGFHDVNKRLPSGATTTVAGVQGDLGYTYYILPFIEQDPLFKLFDKAVGYNTAPNNVAAITQVVPPVYQCPACKQVDTQTANAPTGKTLHYFANMGPRGATPAIPAPGGNYATTGTAAHGPWATQGVLGVNTKYKLVDILDGTSNTFMIGEISWNDAACFRIWTRGCDGNAVFTAKNVVHAMRFQPYTTNNFNDVSYGSEHGGGANFLFTDGSVRFVSESVDIVIYRATASSDGKESQSGSL